MADDLLTADHAILKPGQLPESLPSLRVFAHPISVGGFTTADASVNNICG
jgi:hypothetical protein